jgi:two-component system phosphate regulon sensor histidine kinase PhoR
MFRLSFRTKLLASHVGLVVAVMVVALLDLNRTLVNDLHRQLDVRLLEQARGAAPWVGEGRRHPDKLAGRLALIMKAQVTIIDRGGEVLGESSEDAAKGSPGAEAPELMTARAGGEGLATRSAPGGEKMRYVAVPAGDGWVLRLGAPLADIAATADAMQHRLLFASALAIVLALGLGFVASEVTARPLRAMTGAAERIANGQYDIDLRSTSPDEFGVLSRTLTTLAADLKGRIGDLVAERDRLSAILAGMVEGVVVLDSRKNVLVANPAASTILGVRGELVGLSLDAAVSDPALREQVAAGKLVDGVQEAEVETKDGKAIAIYVRPLAPGSGDVAGGVVTVLRDMTHIRRLLTMRRDFVANVSHELRTPVAAIQGYAETLLERRVDEATLRGFLEIIHRQSRRMGALVDALLTLSQLETEPRDELVNEVVNLGTLTTNVIETLRGSGRAASGAIDVDVAADALAVGDPAGVEQVIQNLLDNALKYGKPGGAVRLRGVRNGGKAVLTVSDDGQGIGAEHLPRLFERFYRVDSGRAREQGGTGLGLAIVKHLVESMGGSVAVESQVGRGTTFRVELPAA